MKRSGRLLALAVCAALLLVGCGDPEPSTTAADAVPSLSSRLQKVDDLVADRRWMAARSELRGIIATANDARASGDLEAVAADRVVASAQRLLAALPTPPPPPSSTPTTQVPPSGDGTSGEGDGDDEDDEEKGGGKGGDNDDNGGAGKGGAKGKGKKDD